MALGEDKGVRVALSNGDVLYLDATLEEASVLLAGTTTTLEDRIVATAHVCQLTYGRVPSVEKLERLPTLED